MLVFASAQLYRLGRSDRMDVRRGLTRVKELISHGVNVAYASNDVRDAFNPFGTGDLLLEGLVVAQAAHMGSDEELATVFDMGTKCAAKVLGIHEGYGIEEGNRADLVIYDSQAIPDVFRSQSEKAYVIKKGKPVAINRRHSQLL